MTTEIDAVQWGRMLQTLEDIRRELTDLKTRQQFRLDNIEARVEALEVAHAGQGWLHKAADRGLWALVAAGCVALFLGGV